MCKFSNPESCEPVLSPLNCVWFCHGERHGCIRYLNRDPSFALLPFLFSPTLFSPIRGLGPAGSYAHYWPFNEFRGKMRVLYQSKKIQMVPFVLLVDKMKKFTTILSLKFPTYGVACMLILLIQAGLACSISLVSQRKKLIFIWGLNSLKCKFELNVILFELA